MSFKAIIKRSDAKGSTGLRQNTQLRSKVLERRLIFESHVAGRALSLLNGAVLARHPSPRAPIEAYTDYRCYLVGFSKCQESFVHTVNQCVFERLTRPQRQLTLDLLARQMEVCRKHNDTQVNLRLGKLPQATQ
jgi:hypothetical protein